MVLITADQMKLTDIHVMIQTRKYRKIKIGRITEIITHRGGDTNANRVVLEDR